MSSPVTTRRVIIGLTVSSGISSHDNMDAALTIVILPASV
jgi:hypothetical protein